MDIFIPIHKRPPNQFIEYQVRRFDDGVGHTGSLKIAIYRDRKNNLCEEVAQVIWDKRIH